jgi:hypothetical protein
MLNLLPTRPFGRALTRTTFPLVGLLIFLIIATVIADHGLG